MECFTASLSISFPASSSFQCQRQSFIRPSPCIIVRPASPFCRTCILSLSLTHIDILVLDRLVTAPGARASS